MPRDLRERARKSTIVLTDDHDKNIQRARKDYKKANGDAASRSTIIRIALREYFVKPQNTPIVSGPREPGYPVTITLAEDLEKNIRRLCKGNGDLTRSDIIRIALREFFKKPHNWLESPRSAVNGQ